jgi:hypothetical protein
MATSAITCRIKVKPVRPTLSGLTRAQRLAMQDAPRWLGEVGNQAKVSLQLVAPVGTPGNSTNPPGSLKKSIIFTPPAPMDTGKWGTVVGPTVQSIRPGPGGHVLNYARVRAWTGATVIHPNVRPYLRFQIHGKWFKKRMVVQHGTPWFTTTADFMRVKARDMVVDDVIAYVLRVQ